MTKRTLSALAALALLTAPALAQTAGTGTQAQTGGAGSQAGGTAGPLGGVGTQTLGTGTVPKPDTGMQPNTVQPGNADARVFVQAVGLSSLAAIQSSKLALERSGNPAVRGYAAQIINDHTKSSDRLHKIALREAMAAPETLDDEHARKLDELRRASGAEFDAKYLQMQAEEHDRDIPIHAGYANDRGGDYHLRDFAADELPVLKSHAQQLQALRGQGGNAGGAAQGGAAQRTPG